MNDLISRQAAIDALAKFVPYAICDESTESYTNGLTDAYNLICQLPSAQTEQRWIPVSERLPEHNQRIIAYYPEHKSTMMINYNAHGFTSMSAWMPLPEPYAERREE